MSRAAGRVGGQSLCDKSRSANLSPQAPLSPPGFACRIRVRVLLPDRVSGFMALLHITDAGGRAWQLPLSPQDVCTIGRAPDNRVVLNDPRASRYHAYVKFQNGSYVLFDGSLDGKLSANHVFVNGEQRLEHPLRDGDIVQIGASRLRLDLSDERRAPEPEARFEDKPLGHTQLLVSANDVIRAALGAHPSASPATAERSFANALNAELE